MDSDLNYILENVYCKCGYSLSSLMKEAESADYSAYTYRLNILSVKFRTAKITPTKIGQFVTLWKRNAEGVTQPHDIFDPIDLVVISVRDNQNFGQFVFPKSALVKHGIFSTPTKEGKRGFRVYPPWDQTNNKQAEKTQRWQVDFFLDLNSKNPLNVERVKKLYQKI